jgi:hypothetical protein
MLLLFAVLVATATASNLPIPIMMSGPLDPTHPLGFAPAYAVLYDNRDIVSMQTCDASGLLAECPENGPDCDRSQSETGVEGELFQATLCTTTDLLFYLPDFQVADVVFLEALDDEGTLRYGMTMFLAAPGADADPVSIDDDCRLEAVASTTAVPSFRAWCGTDKSGATLVATDGVPVPNAFVYKDLKTTITAYATAGTETILNELQAMDITVVEGPLMKAMKAYEGVAGCTASGTAATVTVLSLLVAVALGSLV